MPLIINTAPDASTASDRFDAVDPDEGEDCDGEETPTPKPCKSLHAELSKEANKGDESLDSVVDTVGMVGVNLAALADSCPDLFHWDEPILSRSSTPWA